MSNFKELKVTVPVGKIAYISLITAKVVPFFFTGLSFVTWIVAGKTLSHLVFGNFMVDYTLALACFALGMYYLVKDVTQVKDDPLVSPEEPM